MGKNTGGLPRLVDCLQPGALANLQNAFEPHIYQSWIEKLCYQGGSVFCESSFIKTRCQNEYFKEIVFACEKSGVECKDIKVISSA